VYNQNIKGVVFMKEERIMILKMVDEGKITADDGVKLLKALSRSVDTEEKISKAAKHFKEKVSDIAKEAEPKVKKAAHDIKVKSGEVADVIGEKIKNKMNSAKDTCDCKGDIIEAEDESYSFEYDTEGDAEDKASVAPEVSEENEDE
jgi:polyhydroxyalkanoate synthesis regulator phasin